MKTWVDFAKEDIANKSRFVDRKVVDVIYDVFGIVFLPLLIILWIILLKKFKEISEMCSLICVLSTFEMMHRKRMRLSKAFKSMQTKSIMGMLSTIDVFWNNFETRIIVLL